MGEGDLCSSVAPGRGVKYTSGRGEESQMCAPCSQNDGDPGVTEGQGSEIPAPMAGARRGARWGSVCPEFVGAEELGDHVRGRTNSTVPSRESLCRVHPWKPEAPVGQRPPERASPSPGSCGWCKGADRAWLKDPPSAHTAEGQF